MPSKTCEFPFAFSQRFPEIHLWIPVHVQQNICSEKMNAKLHWSARLIPVPKSSSVVPRLRFTSVLKIDHHESNIGWYCLYDNFQQNSGMRLYELRNLNMDIREAFPAKKSHKAMFRLIQFVTKLCIKSVWHKAMDV